MVTKRKVTGRASTMPVGLGYAAVISMMITVLFAVVIARLVSEGYLDETRIGYGVMITLLMASFCGAWVGMWKIKRQRLVVCCVSGFVYFGILLGITALFFGGQYEAVGVTWVLIMGGSMLALLCGTRPSKGKSGRKRKTTNR